MTATTVSDPAREARHAALRAALPDHLERLAWSADRLRAHQQDALRALLRVAIDRSEFHADRLGSVDPEAFTLDDLGSLPTMTKTQLMGDFDLVVTDPRVTRTRAEAHLAATEFDAAELDGEFMVLASGGSSGQRGLFVYSRAAAIDFLLGLVRAAMTRMTALLGGELPEEAPRMALVAAGSGVHATRALASLFGGDLIDPRSIPATLPIDEIVAQVNVLQPLLLQGYPSVIRQLADERSAGRLTVAPLAVTTTSEALTEDARARIHDAFGVGVSDVFGSSEGLLGVSPPDDPAIVLASDLSLVELVDEDNRPVAPGTPSAKVLVTNLFNPVQPLIRYELTDSFVAHDPAPDHGHLRVSVRGRSDDAFAYGPVAVHPLAVRSVLVKTPEVVEYQVRQTSTGIDVAVVTSVPVDEVGLAERLRAALAAAGLRDPAVAVRTVDASAIVRHPETGKTKRFVPLN